MRPKVILLGILLGNLFTSPTLAQYKIGNPEPGPYLNRYDVNTEKPKGLRDIDNFNLTAPDGLDPDDLHADADGNIRLAGSLNVETIAELPFKIAVLSRGKSREFESLTFTTEERDGIYYEFTGRFLERPVQEKKGGPHTELRGALNKYRNGKKVVTGKIGFSKFAIL